MIGKIMVVDDEAETLLLLKTFLEERGFEVLHLFEGKEALANAKKYRPHLILLDWKLKDIDGLEVFSRLRLERETSKIPVIFITGRTLMGDIEKALAVGVDGYICKPIVLSELLLKIQNALRKV